MHQSMILFMTLSWLSSSNVGIVIQDPQDRCPDIAEDIVVIGMGVGEADNKSDALKAAYEHGVSYLCEAANDIADQFLTNEAQCLDGCVATESWWDWCDMENAVVTHEHCMEVDSKWYCTADMTVTITAHMTCEPQVP